DADRLRGDPPPGRAGAVAGHHDPARRGGGRADRVLHPGHPPPRAVPGGRVPVAGQRDHRHRVPGHRRCSADRRTRRLLRPAVGRAGAAGADHPAAHRVRQQRPGRTTGAARLMTMTVLLAPIGLPLAAALGYAAAGWRRRTTAWAGVLATALLAADAIGLAAT